MEEINALLLAQKRKGISGFKYFTWLPILTYRYALQFPDLFSNVSLFHCLKAQITSLQNKLAELKASIKSSWNKVEPGEVAVMELTLSCDNLRCDGHGWPPSPQASLEVLDKSSMSWKSVGQTENVEECSNPVFLVTFPLWSGMDIKPDTR